MLIRSRNGTLTHNGWVLAKLSLLKAKFKYKT